MTEDYKKPFVPIWMEQAGFTLHQYRVLCHLWSRGQGRCYPSMDLIASSCGIRRGTVCKVIKELEVAGFVTRRKRKSKGIRFANEYILTGAPAAPVKNEPGHLEHRLTRICKAPVNRDTWSTGNDTSVNDSPMNESPLLAGEVLPSVDATYGMKNPIAELVKTIWDNTPPKGRERSSKKQLEDALKKTLAKDRPGQAEIMIALEAWKASELWSKEGGQYVAGIHRWVNDRKWESPPEPRTPTVNLGGRDTTNSEAV
jgi:hypothetical protein